MPVIILNPEQASSAIGTVPVQPTYPNNGGNIVIGQQSKLQTSLQIGGLMPMTKCDYIECRTLKNPCCYTNLVFGNIVNGSGVAGPTYENDLNSILFNVYTLNQSSVVITLEKLTGNTWSLATVLNNNSYGTYYGIGTIPNHSTYAGYTINWGLVLDAFGAGIYRILFIVDTISRDSFCFSSEQYNLLAWDCDRAHGTVKFESRITGKIGDKRTDYLLHDYSGFTWYDSIRVNGFFGYEKIGEYKTVNIEWGNPYHGKVVKVRDEAIQSFEFKMRQDTPQWIHTRLMTYAMMCDDLRVSDYNINNSDYDIKQLGVIRDSGWEPTYFNDKWRRVAGVKVAFKRAVQGVIKTNC